MQQQPQIAVELVVRGDKRRVALVVEAGPARAAENLLHVQNAQVLEAADRGVEDVRALDHDCPRGQVHAPSQGGGATQHPRHARKERLLRERPVGPQHPRVVHAEAPMEQVRDLLVPRLLELFLPVAVLRVLPGVERALLVPLLRDLHQCRRRLECVASRMHENHDLVALSHLLDNHVVGDLVQLRHEFHGVCLRHADEGGVERDRAVGGIEVEQVLAVHAHEVGDVPVVRQCGRESNEAHRLTGGLLVFETSRHHRLDDRASVVVQ
mmetsp:Transcript_55929/g.162111  ORF Transcript_55929/g.162111 Transcript_55929/m.162111 type:complete len:267 (+) Transcript_55929:996-1796(+)